MRPRLPLRRFGAVWPGESLSLWYGALLGGSNQRGSSEAGRTAKCTLLFCALGLTNIRQKPRMRRAKIRVIGARLVQAQLAVHRQAHFAGVRVFLAVILPPANRAQLQGPRRFQRLISTTGATITDFNRGAHTGIDGKMRSLDYGSPQAIRHLHGFLMSFWVISHKIPRMSLTTSVREVYRRSPDRL